MRQMNNFACLSRSRAVHSKSATRSRDDSATAIYTVNACSAIDLRNEVSTSPVWSRLMDAPRNDRENRALWVGLQSASFMAPVVKCDGYIDGEA